MSGRRGGGVTGYKENCFLGTRLSDDKKIKDRASYPSRVHITIK